MNGLRYTGAMLGILQTAVTAIALLGGAFDTAVAGRSGDAYHVSRVDTKKKLYLYSGGD